MVHVTLTKQTKPPNLRNKNMLCFSSWVPEDPLEEHLSEASRVPTPIPYLPTPDCVVRIAKKEHWLIEARGYLMEGGVLFEWIKLA